MAALIRDSEGRSAAPINVSGQAMRTSATVMADCLLPQLLAPHRRWLAR
ncbi:MAG: hypothetical protein H7238_04520 [Polaromonas sp.]|nr:hypothetical protein [Polaromonas sp.]